MWPTAKKISRLRDGPGIGIINVFNVAFTKILRDLIEKIDNVYEKMEKFSSNVNAIKNRILEWKI